MNYQQFFRLLVCVSLYGVAFIVLGCVTFRIQSQPLRIWIIVNIGIVGLMFILNFNLMLFHFYLKFRGQTTYDFIIQRRQNQVRQVQQQMPTNLWYIFFLYLSTSKKQNKKIIIRINIES
ncbi:hypothetical protein pb186bvf_013791 [Paramecium bursaria]